uniref:Uncharacterized protein n=1 Tax=Rhizophora mucronata TaxID=61149 RepID=A0A2P2PYQ6_RHIMU
MEVKINSPSSIPVETSYHPHRKDDTGSTRPILCPQSSLH